MSNPHKAKGDRFEIALTAYLQSRGFDAERTRAGYERDFGDIHLAREVEDRPRVVVQCKNTLARATAGVGGYDLGGFLGGVAKQRDAIKAQLGFVVVKRPRIADPGRQYAVLELDWLLDLLDRAGYRVQSDQEEDAS